MFGYYTPNQGSSKGDHFLEVCFGVFCPTYQYHPNQDNLNAAQSGAMASNLIHELNYLIPTLKSYPGIDYLNDWKFLNLQIGTNDLCSSCMDPYGFLTADMYEQNVRNALEIIRMEVPKVVVNLISTFNASEIYGVTLNNRYCELFSGLPRINIECKCALVSGPAGDITRASMNGLSSELNIRLLNIRNDYAANPNDTFGVVYQPANIVFPSIPIEGFSNIDCFHPSRMSHAWIAKVMWSGLFTPLSDKGANLVFDASYPVFCPSETDRIRLD